MGITQLAHTVGESIRCHKGGDAARLKRLWEGLVSITDVQTDRV